jgi:hypothetical protein
MGSWYLGGSATGVEPQSAGSRSVVTAWAVLAGVTVSLTGLY